MEEYKQNKYLVTVNYCTDFLNIDKEQAIYIGVHLCLNNVILHIVVGISMATQISEHCLIS